MIRLHCSGLFMFDPYYLGPILTHPLESTYFSVIRHFDECFVVFMCPLDLNLLFSVRTTTVCLFIIIQI